MIKLMKYLKTSFLTIIFIVIMLGIQAVCDLSLPEYTSKIVNIGIGQNGIEDTTPKVIREENYIDISMFISSDDMNVVNENYRLISKDNLNEDEYKNYLKEYPLLEKTNIYILTAKNNEVVENLNDIFAKPIFLYTSLTSGYINTEEIKKELMPLVDSDINEDISFMEFFRLIPREFLEDITDNIQTRIENLPDSIITQGAISYLKSEYKIIGVDVDKVQTNYILNSGAKMLGIALISMAATVLVGYLGARVAATLGKKLRNKVFEKVLSFSTIEFKKFSTASLITRSTNDIQQVQGLIVMLLRIVIYAPILGIGGVLKVLNTDTSMAWIIGVAILAILSIVIVLFATVMPKFKVIQKLIDKLNLTTREILTGLPVIRAFSREKYEEKRFDKANDDLKKTNLFVGRVMGGMMPMMMLIMNLITILIIYKGAYSIDNGAMQVGDLMAFIQYTMQIIMAFLMISMVSIMLPRASVSMKRIDEILATEPAIKDPINPKIFNDKKIGHIEFKNVSFKYPDAEQYVIENISFKALPGQTTAFIGSTGSGKSTIVNLIPRFFDVSKGQILVNGVDIREVRQNDLRSKIGYVPQKGILFSGTINTNMKLGNELITETDIEKATKIAQASTFIEEKENKYESEISQGGSNVSGGQRQRLSIARAIATKPSIYIFDDSFSALDFKTDAALRFALKEETKSSTVLIVSQRVSTILHAEQIIVLEEGKIVGIGNHKELIKNCDVYKEIVLSQLGEEELINE